MVRQANRAVQGSTVHADASRVCALPHRRARRFGACSEPVRVGNHQARPAPWFQPTQCTVMEHFWGIGESQRKLIGLNRPHARRPHRSDPHERESGSNSCGALPVPTPCSKQGRPRSGDDPLKTTREPLQPSAIRQRLLPVPAQTALPRRSGSATTHRRRAQTRA